MARKNDATVRAGQRGRTLVNRDILRITDTDPHGQGCRFRSFGGQDAMRPGGKADHGRSWSPGPF